MKDMVTVYPEVVVVHFKRFAFDGAPKKLDHFISFDFELSLPDLAQTVYGQPPRVYDLESVVYHSGSMEGGHYTAISRRGLNWFYFDDERKPLRLTADELEGMFNEAAYLLFYRREPQP